MRILIDRGKKEAITGKNINLTYDALLRRISYFNSVLGKISGNRIAIFSDNKPEWVIAFYAIWKGKGIAVPVDALSTAHDVAYILKDARPDAVFVSADKKYLLQDAMKESDFYPAVHVFEEFCDDDGSYPNDRIEIVNDEATAVILYTSGTTGSPKGVMLSFKNLFANLDAVCHDVTVFTPEDRVMILLPLHHIFSLMGTMIAPLYVRATMVFNTSLAAEEMLATLQHFKVTILIGVPRLYQLLYKGLNEKISHSVIAKTMLNIASVINSLKFSRFLFATVHKKFGGSIKYMVSGGAAIEAKIVSFFMHLGFEILEGYGMTETAPMITFTRPGTVKPGIPGQPLNSVRVEIREEEIVVSGDVVMQGYYNKPGETDEVLKDGWLYTGDLGFVDEQGYLNITGRKKDIIVLPNGKNINPSELEEMLVLNYKEVKECGVFLKDGALHAIVLPDFKVLNEMGIKDLEQHIKWNIIDVFNRSVSPFKKILKFHITGTELPKTRLGKIKRFALEEMISEKKDSHVSEPVTHEYQVLKKFLEDETQQTVLPHHHIELDLALDSLGKVSLSAFIDTAFGVDIKEDSLADFGSVEKLAEFVTTKKTKLSLEGINWSKILQEKVHFRLPKSGLMHNMFKTLSRMFLRLSVRMKVEGLENLPDFPCIIAPNHQSSLDGFLVASFFKRKFMKKTFVYAKERHFRNPFLRFLAHRSNIILVDINKDLKLSIQKLAEVLKKGKNLMIFPEGTRTLNGKIGDFKQTFAILSHELKIPVIPVAIRGSYDIMPSGSRFPRLFKKVTVSFLTPVYPENHTYESLRNIVYQHVAGKLGD
ncbi:MAG: AMP-binding protein [Bacteroidales bacterium]|nr:AMP-binding protein [Bacteroidales bacterium]